MADYAIHEETLTGVSNVIRKKDGTSALIDPADYPKRINLMGMLEEKTVSGAIATFADGADSVPLKKCEITLPASLDGYSEVDVVSAGKNLFDNSEFPKTISDTNYYGQFQSNVGIENRWYIPEIHIIPDIQYTLSFDVLCNVEPFNISIGIGRGGYLRDLTTATNRTSGRNSITFTLTSALKEQYGNILTFRVPRYNSTTSFEFTISNIQLEVGATATTYEPYTAPTTHTADLGRTIYGGSVDVVNGQGESICGKIVFDGSSDENWTAYAGGNGYLIAVADMERGTWYTSELAESYPLSKVPDNSTLGVRIGVNNNGIYVVQANTISGVTDLASFKAYLAENPLTVIYPLDDSETFTFDPVPIDSKLGNNTIWSEQGDNTEVTYRGQGTTTPILPTLVTKSITENGTYSAEDDDADGYSEVTVNVESVVKIGINSGKLNIANGTITADSAWCYTDTFDCPSGNITMDFGESDINVGIELVYASDNSHANYWTNGNGLRYREVDISSYYSPTKKARLSFRRQYLSKVLLMDFGNGKIYSSLTASQFEEPQANLLSMNSTESEESEGSENE